MTKLETCFVDRYGVVCINKEEVYIDETKISAIQISPTGTSTIKMVNDLTVYVVTSECAWKVLRMLEER